jgi:hypothetical protein
MKFADTKVVIRVDNTLTQRKKKDKRTNNDLQSTSQKTKDLTTWTPLKTGSDLGCSWKVSSSCSNIQWVQHITVQHIIMSSNLLCPTHYNVQQFTVSSKILSPHLLIIYTCQHAVVVSCFALHSPLF